MDDESIVTPPAEAIATQEGSVGSISTVIETTPAEARTVPEHDLLAVKDKAQRKENELKARIKELEDKERAGKPSPDLESLKAKYQGVDADFLDDVASLIDRKAEEKLAPVRNQQKQESFEKQWNTLYNDQLAKAEGIDPSKVDQDVIRTLALSPQYRNKPIKDIIEMLHKVESTGRATTENDMRPAMDLVSEVIDIDAPIPKDKLKKIFDDPKARKAYFDKKYE